MITPIVSRNSERTTTFPLFALEQKDHPWCEHPLEVFGYSNQSQQNLIARLMSTDVPGSKPTSASTWRILDLFGTFAGSNF